MKGIHKKIFALLMVVVLFANDAEVSAAGRSFLGKNNWLFYNAEGDGSTIYDYKGVNHYSPFGLKRVANNLLAAQSVVNKKGAEFVVFFAPNKETIYSNYMPKRIKRKTTYTRYDQLYDYLTLNTDLQVAYPKEELLAYRNKYELYYPTDNHWNRKGQFIGVQELMDITDGKRVSIDDVKFRVTKSYHGDLNVLSYGKYNISCRHYTFTSKVKAKDKSKKKVLLVGDSFAGRMQTIAKRYYKKVTFCHINDFRMKKVKGYDVVVWEAVERYQDRFTRINFSRR
ncbi:MAG: hypothetical protein SO170_07635 [Butyribacter sp.]|nr:hypothetical protein [bacterium]MDY3854806.1 hypothetical protein [Butyribacter sp.]